MYIPPINRMDNDAEIILFIKEYSFAPIVSLNEGKIISTHLPFVIEQKDGKLQIIGHFAKANPQWMSLENQEVLIIFSEPHAYISPSHYDSNISVPTWNYIAVHVYGQCRLVHDELAAKSIIEKTINTFEQHYFSQWKELPEKYITGMLNGIVCFEMKVTDIQAKKKLSQNKSETERNRIIDSLDKSNDQSARRIGEWMKKG